MKTLLIILSVFVLSLSASALAPHEKASGDIYNMNQVTKIHTVMLNSLDEDIASTQAFFDQEIDAIQQTSDMEEGRQLAGMIALIGNDLMKLKETRVSLETKREILDADIEPLHARLSELRKIIEEINLD